MKMRIVLPLLLASVAGLGAIAIIRSVMINNAGSASVQGETQVVVFAAADLQAAERIDESMLKMDRMPVALVPMGAFSDAQKLVGRVLKSDVSTKMPITETLLAPEGSLAGLEGKLPSGYRAKTLKVDEWSGVGGFVLPGSRVDVVSTFRDSKTNNSQAKTILRNIEVLAVGQNLSAESKAAKESKEGTAGRTVMSERSVTLKLSEKQVETVVAYEANGGQLSLSLRSGSDTDVVEDEVEPLIIQSTEMVAQAAPKEDSKTTVQSGPERIVTYEVRGEVSEPVAYVKVNGRWQREIRELTVLTSSSSSSGALPTVKNQSNDSQTQAPVLPEPTPESQE